MKTVNLGECEIWDFRSFAYAKVMFPAIPGFHFLGGDNQTDASLGSNGAGKSTLWNAIFWCLYGVSIQGKRASDLTRWGANKCAVVVIFYVDTIPTKIKRESNPNKLWIDDELAPQEEVTELLGLTEEQARHSVFFGQGVGMLPDLSMADRVDLLDSALDLSIWAKLGQEAGLKLSKLDAELRGAELTIAEARGKAMALEESSIDKLKMGAEQFELDTETKIAELRNQLKSMRVELTTKKQRLNKLSLTTLSKTDDYQKTVNTLRRELAKTSEEAGINIQKQREANKLIKFYNNATTCPTCFQEIDPYFIDEQTQKLQKDLDVLGAKLVALREREINTQNTVDSIEAKIAEINTHNAEHKAQVAKTKEIINQLEFTIKKLDNELELNLIIVNPHEERLNQVQIQVKEAKQLLASVAKTKLKISTEIMQAEYWRQGFKRLRMYQLRRSMDYLTLQANNHAEQLGLLGWAISFVTETETKSGTSKLGVQIIIKAPDGNQSTLESYSGGEAARIRLAVALGFSSMLQNLKGVDWRLEVWDEPGHWLSSEGMEDLLTTLSQRATAAHKHIWICSHSAMTYAGFSDVWTVVKTNEGSRVI